MGLEKLVKNATVRIMAGFAAFYLITNIPQATYTFTAPKEEIKGTLVEQLDYDTHELSDVSGGTIFANFRLLGICIGYEARKLVDYIR